MFHLYVKSGNETPTQALSHTQTNTHIQTNTNKTHAHSSSLSSSFLPLSHWLSRRQLAGLLPHNVTYIRGSPSSLVFSVFSTAEAQWWWQWWGWKNILNDLSSPLKQFFYDACAHVVALYDNWLRGPQIRLACSSICGAQTQTHCHLCGGTSSW